MKTLNAPSEKQKQVTAMLAGMQKSWEEHCRKVAIYRATFSKK